MRKLFLLVLCIGSCVLVHAACEDRGSYTPTPSDPFIPNFGRLPTIWSIVDGPWSDPSTWSQNRVPSDGDVVGICGNRVEYDVLRNTPIKVIAVQEGGTLSFNTHHNTKLVVETIHVHSDGALEIGTLVDPVSPGFTAEIIFSNTALDTSFDPAQYGHGLVALGKVVMHGAPKNHSFMRLTGEVKTPANTLILEDSIEGWNPGEDIYVPDTRQPGDNHVYQRDIVKLAGVSGGGKELTLQSPLQFDHLGGKDGDGKIDFYPHAVNLTRNIILRSEDAQGTRGHVLFTYRAAPDIRYVMFQDLGRTVNLITDNTLFSSNGQPTHIGTNQQGRYPLHFHRDYGPAQTPLNGYQVTCVGNVVRGGRKWGITIHDTHYGLFQENVVYDVEGASIIFEIGNESFNVLERNFASLCPGDNHRGDAHTFDANLWAMEGVGYWIGSFNNYIRSNVAANVTQAAFMGYGGNPNVKIPAYPGADPTVAGQFITKNLFPILQFEKNEVYGTQLGFTVWWLGANYTSISPITESVVKDFWLWHINVGIFLYPANNLTFDHLVIRGDPRWLGSNGYSTAGFSPSDYLNNNLKFIRCDIQNMQSGIGAQGNMVDRSDPNGPPVGTFTVEDSYLRNFNNFYDPNFHASQSAWSTGHRRTILRNVRFGPKLNNVRETEQRQSNVYMYLQQYGSNAGNTWPKDEVFVYDYQGVPGNNFQIYYKEQAADFIPLKSNIDGNGGVGSPEEGLNNQQLWEKYNFVDHTLKNPPNVNTPGVAIAGAVAPCLDDATHPEIYGFVCNFGAVDNPPTIAIGANVDSNPVTGKTAALHVGAADDGGEANLIYTWSVLGPSLGDVIFSANGTNAAKETTATFSKAGAYVFRVVVRDSVSQTVASDVAVQVNQTFSTLEVTPTDDTVLVLTVEQFLATPRDQFNRIMDAPSSFNWAVSGGGTINSGGLFTAGAVQGGPFVVTAQSGVISGTANVFVSNNIPPTVTITSPPPGLALTAPANVTIKADAHDANGSVSKVEFLLNGQKVGEDASEPYSWMATALPIGTYDLAARAIDNEGAKKTSSIVRITINPEANQAPAIELIKPEEGTIFSAPAQIAVEANATDADGSIAQVDFLNGSTILKSLFSPPFRFGWTNVFAGAYKLSAKAMDNKGAVGVSTTISVEVKASGAGAPYSLGMRGIVGDQALHGSNKTIRFALIGQGTVKIRSRDGELVKTITGKDLVTWGGENSSGKDVGSGVYKFVLSDDNGMLEGKVAVVR